MSEISNMMNNVLDAMQGVGHKAQVGAERQPRNIGGVRDYEPKLTVRTKSENRSVTIEIKDNGQGIPDEIKNKIMQPFFTTKKGTQGTGLGLSITNDIIKAHGGSLSVRSDNQSTLFEIKLMK